MTTLSFDNHVPSRPRRCTPDAPRASFIGTVIAILKEQADSSREGLAMVGLNNRAIRRILVVDDRQEVLRTMSDLLKHEGLCWHGA